jgi:hypothetical protein
VESENGYQLVQRRELYVVEEKYPCTHSVAPEKMREGEAW